MSKISDSQFESYFVERMREWHDDLPYHNFDGHVMSAIGYFESIASDLRTKDVHIDRRLGRLSLFAHDAGYHEDHTAEGYGTKEEYSAAIAEAELNDMGMAHGEIEIVRGAILATHFQAAAETNLEKAVRLADIGNVSASETEFLRNMGLLIQEAAVMKVPLKETFTEHCHATQSFLNAYLNPAPTFTASDGSEVQLDRHMSFVNNIKRLGSLPLGTLLRASENIIIPLPTTWR